MGISPFFLDLSAMCYVAVHTILATAVGLDFQHEHATLESALTALERSNRLDPNQSVRYGTSLPDDNCRGTDLQPTKSSHCWLVVRWLVSGMARKWLPREQRNGTTYLTRWNGAVALLSPYDTHLPYVPTIKIAIANRDVMNDVSAGP
jgi:hypothetical protein